MESGVGKWVSYLNRERKLDAAVGRRPAAPPAPKGLYLYGNVGSGMSYSKFMRLNYQNLCILRVSSSSSYQSQGQGSSLMSYDLSLELISHFRERSIIVNSSPFCLI